VIDIFLHGNLGEEVGEKWTLDVSTPNEALRAIDANTEKLYKYFFEKERDGLKYYVFVDKDNISKGELALDISSRKEMHVIPSIEGEGKFKEIFKNDMFLWGAGFAAGGMALNYMSGWDFFSEGGYGGGNVWLTDTSWGEAIRGLGGIFMEIGVALMVQGVIEVIQGDPDHPDVADDPTSDSTASFIFENPGNNVIQGAVVPLGYGRLRIGSHVISSSLLNSRFVEFDDVDIEMADENTDTAQHVDLIKQSLDLEELIPEEI
jgi:predicted phage tail protein